jgi:hypothetical protein
MAASTLGLILCCCVGRDKGAACRHQRPVLLIVIGDENAGRASRQSSKGWSSACRSVVVLSKLD